MSKKCAICNNKIGIFNKYKVLDGFVCSNCISISDSFQTDTIEELKKYWDINNSRLSIFNTTTVLKNLGTTPIYIDAKNNLFIIGKKNNKIKSIVYSFSEVNNYSIETIGEKTITNKKGTISRSIAGGLIAGPVGAVICANTAKEETKVVGGISMLKINMTIPSGKHQITLTYYPNGFTNFLDKCIVKNDKQKN